MQFARRPLTASLPALALSSGMGASGNSWTETVLFNFPGGTTGTNPAAGFLYYRGTVVGATSTGGSGPCSGTYTGCGMVYRGTLQ